MPGGSPRSAVCRGKDNGVVESGWAKRRSNPFRHTAIGPMSARDAAVIPTRGTKTPEETRELTRESPLDGCKEINSGCPLSRTLVTATAVTSVCAG